MQTKTVSFVTILMLLIATILSATNFEISGNISASTTWTDVDTVKVTGDIIVNNGRTLTIDPGIYVEFQGHYKLDIQGTLLAIGTTDEVITFTAADHEIGWNRIILNSPSTSNDSTKIVYCKLEYGKSIDYYDSGGAIYVNSFDKVLISHSTFSNNNAEYYGGGLYCENSDIEIKYCDFDNNNAVVYGGGIFIEDCNPILINNLIRNNDSNNCGGVYFNNSNAVLINNTIVNNSGNGIWCQNGAEPVFRNTIIYGNSGAQVYLYDSSVDPKFYYCNIEGGISNFEGSGAGGNYTGDYENCINADPKFVGSGLHTYDLLNSSPCFNAGDTNTTTADVGDYDLAGENRIQQGRIDIGAYETYNNPDGFPGCALEFDGINDYVSVPSDVSLNNDQITVEFWTRMDNPGKWEGIVDKGRDTNSDWCFLTGNEGETEGIIFGIGNGSSTQELHYSWNDLQWHHIAGTYDGTTMRLYVDGESRGSAVVSMSNTNNNITFGSRRNFSWQFEGKLDEVVVWDTARSLEDIRENIHLTLSESETGLVSYYQFNEDSGTFCYELISGNDGTMVNMDDTDRIESTVPVGNGHSVTQIVSGGGPVSFSDVGVFMDFILHSETDTFVVTRIDRSPNINPADVYETFDSQYWVINQYGTGTFEINLSFAIQEELTSEDEQILEQIQAYRRESNADTEWYFSEYADNVVAQGYNEVMFEDITEFSQFIVCRNLVPDIQIEADTLNFENVFIGYPESDTLTIYNTGDDTLFVSDISNNNPNFYPDITNCEISQGDSCNVVITFSPTTEGLITDTLIVTSNDPDEAEVEVFLTGEGFTPYPDINIETDTLYFGDVFIDFPESDTLTIYNTGDDTLFVSDVSNNNPDFYPDITNCEIPQGDSAYVNITFSPTTEGVITDTLIITSNDPDEPVVSFILTGEGIIPYPDIHIETDTLNFGEVFIDFPESDTLTIYNTGDDTLFVSDISNNNPDFSPDITNCEIPQSDSVYVDITFSPSIEGVITDTLIITSNDPDEPVVSFILTGEGIIPYPDIQINADSLNFGDVFVGYPITKTLTIFNVADDPLFVNNISSNNPDYFPNVTNCKVPPRGSFDVNITFSPSIVGVINETLTISSNDQDDPIVEIIVSGKGYEHRVITTVKLPLNLSYITDDFINIMDPASMGGYFKPVFTDIDGDGLLDLILGGSGTLWHYEQDFGSSTSFSLITYNFDSINVGLESAPTFTDLDGDDLLDLIIGESYGNLNHYEQDSENSTSFSLITENFNSINVGYSSTPSFIDLDGDGLLDLIIGETDGNLYHYEQDFENSTSFSLVTENFDSINVGLESAPTFTDLDGDGILDLIIGERSGNLNHYEQDFENSTSFSLVTENFNSIDVGIYSTPTFTDLDGDYLLDLIIGREDASVHHFEQDGIEALYFGNEIIGESNNKKYYLKCTDLSNDLSIELPTGFSASLSENSGFAQNFLISPINGSISDTLFIRFDPGYIMDYSGDIVHSSTGAPTKYISVSGKGVESTDNFPGTALNFDGDDDYISIPDEEDFDFTTSMTVEAWIKVDEFDKDYQAIVTKGNDSWRLYRNYDTDFICFKAGRKYLYGSINVNDGNWHHIAGVHNNNEVWLYVDGKIDAYSSDAVSTPNGNYPVWIGANAEKDDRNFDGQIEEVRIWDIARDSLQIRENMHLTLSGFETGLIAYWQFNEGSGTIANACWGIGGVLHNLDDNGWITSTVATGSGESDTQTETDGTIEFTDTGLSMFFNSQNGAEITVTRIDTLANINPTESGEVFVSQYWVVNRMGSGIFDADLTFILSEDLTVEDEAEHDQIQLYTRSSNADTNWVNLSDASFVNAAINEVTFDGITDFSQFIVCRWQQPLDPPQNVVIEIIGTNVHISWEAVNGANSYKIFASDDLYGTFTEDDNGIFTNESWSAPVPNGKMFYYVVASSDAVRDNIHFFSKPSQVISNKVSIPRKRLLNSKRKANRKVD